MIEQLRLTNWRNYEGVEIELNAGTTFVVASNGVGKTSLVEAARYALFGVTPPDGSVVRAGHAQSTVTIKVRLPSGRVLVITRDLKRSLRRGENQPPPLVRVDGAAMPHSDFATLLTDEYGGTRQALARLTMPAEVRELDRPSRLGLSEHLGQYFGINGLQAAATDLRLLRKQNDSKIRKIKQVNAIDAKRVEDLRHKVDAAISDAQQAAVDHREVSGRLSAAQDLERTLTAAALRRAAREQRQADLHQLAADASSVFGETLNPGNLATELNARAETIDEELAAIRVEIGVIAYKREALVANEERLDSAHQDCPVCRRPLDEETLDAAHRTTSIELAELETNDADLRVQEMALDARRVEIARLRGLLLSALPMLGPAPIEESQLEATTGPDIEELEDAVQIALDRLVEARRLQTQLESDLAAASAANRAMQQLAVLFRNEATLRAALEATEKTLDEVLRETVTPLSKQIGERWKNLFPDRGDLQTLPDGTMTRRLANDEELPFDSFSTGEGMVATLLTRLLVTHLATNADFCWFDEPLEHLDPDVRRHVANMLARVTASGGPVRQVLVTTYEEPLARQLASRDGRQVHLIDIRQEAHLPD